MNNDTILKRKIADLNKILLGGFFMAILLRSNDVIVGQS